MRCVRYIKCIDNGKCIQIWVGKPEGKKLHRRIGTGDREHIMKLQILEDKECLE
jgi:hypothetical protein